MWWLDYHFLSLGCDITICHLENSVLYLRLKWMVYNQHEPFSRLVEWHIILHLVTLHIHFILLQTNKLGSITAEQERERERGGWENICAVFFRYWRKNILFFSISSKYTNCHHFVCMCLRLPHSIHVYLVNEMPSIESMFRKNVV